MPYCTLADIEKMLPYDFVAQLTDDDGIDEENPEFETNQEIVDRAIADAGEEIDGYLRGRYSLPLNPAPDLLRKLAVDISVYHVHSRRSEMEVPDTVKDRYKNAVRLLEGIAAGKISLGGEAGNTPEPGAFKTNKSSSDKVFTDELLSKI